jgi:hypothetical protein
VERIPAASASDDVGDRLTALQRAVSVRHYLLVSERRSLSLARQVSRRRV